MPTCTGLVLLNIWKDINIHSVYSFLQTQENHRDYQNIFLHPFIHFSWINCPRKVCQVIGKLILRYVFQFWQNKRFLITDLLLVPDRIVVTREFHLSRKLARVSEIAEWYLWWTELRFFGVLFAYAAIPSFLLFHAFYSRLLISFIIKYSQGLEDKLANNHSCAHLLL